MEWLEIISVEVAELKKRKKVIELCNRISIPPSAELTVYWINLSNELSIHIQWGAQSAPKRGRSRLGRELGRTLSDHGLVTHTLWVEYDQPGKNT